MKFRGECIQILYVCSWSLFLVFQNKNEYKLNKEFWYIYFSETVNKFNFTKPHLKILVSKEYIFNAASLLFFFPQINAILTTE